MAFSVEGYTSLYSLMSASGEEVLKANRPNELFRYLTKDLGIKHAIRFLQFYPRRRIIEQVVLNVTDRLGVFLCNPSGCVVALEAPLYSYSESIQFISRIYGERLSELKSQSFLEVLMFKQDCDYIKESCEGKSLKPGVFDEMGECWERGNGQVPLFHSRLSYTIDTTVYRFLKKYSDDPNFPYGEALGAFPDFIGSFEGASLCIRKPHNLDGLIAEIASLCYRFLHGALANDWDDYGEELSRIGGSSKGQRGGVVSAKRGVAASPAKKVFQDLYPDGKPDNLSADAVAAQLEQLGYPISPRSVYNWEKEIKGK